MKALNPILVESIKQEILDDSVSITEDLLIEDDLGISGDDADEFIVAFSQKFDVDITEFHFDVYFNSEPGMFNKMKRKNALTIGMLDEAIYTKKLV